MSKTLTNLRSLTRYYALGSSSSTDYSDADTLLNLNTRYQEAFLLATENDGEFQINGDGSQSISITSGTRAYTLATDLFKVSRVEIKYPSSAANYREAVQIKGGHIFYNGKDDYTTSIPQFDLLAKKVEIFISAKTASIEAVTNGIKVYYQKELTELSVADDAIIFPDTFARYIAIGAAIDYCIANELSRINFLEREHQKAEAKLTKFISDRNKATNMRITFKRENYGVEGSGDFVASDKVAF